MNNITSIHGYCKEINIPPPKHPHFDVRKFEQNMKSVNAKQPAFRHEFYAVALKNSGENKEVNGQFLDSNLFFNSPYQIITWDIKPDWQGWYIIFDKEFLGTNPGWQNFLIDFPFFRLDKVSYMDLQTEDAKLANNIFQQIFEEYHSDNKDKFLFIQSFTQLLLLITKRYYEKQSGNSSAHRSPEILLLSRFQSLVEIMVNDETRGAEVRQVSFYANELNVHPNYLNATVKNISGNTAITIIQKQVISAAKALLKQTSYSVKEVAFKLHFSAPTHFNAAFKKGVGCTPLQFRLQTNL